MSGLGECDCPHYKDMSELADWISTQRSKETQRHADLIRELRELRRYNVHRVPFSPHYAISADELDATLGRHEQEQA